MGNEKLTPREQAIALLAEEYGTTKAHVADILARTLGRLKPEPADPPDATAAEPGLSQETPPAEPTITDR